MFFKCDENANKKTLHERAIQRIRDKQWRLRSKVREKLHVETFGTKPLDIENIQLIPTDEQTQKIIQNLANCSAIISNKIYHWTTLSNFLKIIETQYFFGNQVLNFQKIPFQKNALGENDIKNGDSKVICFCVYFVDILALIESNAIRNNLIRLTVDLNKVECKGEYNQFFKLCDFESPSFQYHVNITDQFSVSFQKNRLDLYKAFDFAIVFKLDSHGEFSVKVAKEEAIFYGDLYTINIFCLTRLFYFIEKISDFKFKEKLKNYIFSRDEFELKKILVTFAQSLTIHSEYNFNGAVKLSQNLITEVYLAKENRYVSLVDQPPQMYIKTINEAKRIRDEKSQSDPILSLKKINYYSLFHGKAEDINLFFNGIRIIHSIRAFSKLESDFRNISSQIFSSNEYYETRTAIVKHLSDFESHFKQVNLANSNSKSTLESDSENLSDSEDLPPLESDSEDTNELPPLEEEYQAVNVY